MSTLTDEIAPKRQEIELEKRSEAIAFPSQHPWRHFAAHYLEMSVVMGIGMVVTAFCFMVVLNIVVDGEVTWEQALVDYPAHALLAVAIGMSVPMIPWMRYRGHSKRTAYEMAIVMAVPVIPFICLALFDVVEGAQCGLYCIAGFLAMFAFMLYRRDDYRHRMPRRIRVETSGTQ